MADLKIEVPITIKGGKGDKVGKQIGDKIAATLNKSLKSIGIGRTQSSAGAGGGGGSFLGMSKGITSMVTKLSVIGVIAASALSLMKKSSGYLRGVLSVFGRAITIFFKPFGDFLASLLRPLAILLMKAAVAWLKFTRTGIGGKVVGTALGAGGGALAGAAIGALGGPIGAGLGALIGAGLALLAQIDWEGVYNKMLMFGGWLWENIKKIWDWVYDFNSWLWGNLITIWNYTSDLGGWLWNKLVSVWNYVMDFGTWLWEKLKSVWNYVMDFGGWLWGKITGIWSWGYNLGRWLWNKITNALSNVGSYFGFGNEKGYATGTAFVPETGMYKLVSVWNYVMDFGTWLWEKLKSVWNYVMDFGGWLWGKITGIWSWGYNLGRWLWNKITNALSNVGSYFGFGNEKGYATGTAFVPETGMYKLHRGESVVSRVQNNSSSNQSIILKPTIQIMGNSSGVDPEEMARRFSSMTMMELKSRGIV